MADCHFTGLSHSPKLVIKPAHCFFGLLSTKQFISRAHSVFAWLALVLIEALQLTPASFFKISNYGSSRCGYHQSNDLIFHHTFGAVLTPHNFSFRLGKLVLPGGLCQIHFSRENGLLVLKCHLCLSCCVSQSHFTSLSFSWPISNPVHVLKYYFWIYSS